MQQQEQLENKALIKIIGEDRYNFLQNLVTNDINKINKLQYSLILTPQGRFNFELFIYDLKDYLMVEIYQQYALNFLSKIKLYKLKSKVEIVDVSDKFRVWVSNEPIANSLVTASDPRIVDSLFYRNIMPINYNEFSGKNFYKELKFQHLLPETDKELIIEKTFPLEWGMEYLNAIDFDKGCYVGQELTTRTKFRGEVRKRPYLILSLDGLKADEVTNMDGKKIGKISDKFASKAIALIRDEQQQIEQLLVNQMPVKLSLPRWYAK